MNWKIDETVILDQSYSFEEREEIRVLIDYGFWFPSLQNLNKQLTVLFHNKKTTIITLTVRNVLHHMHCTFCYVCYGYIKQNSNNSFYSLNKTY